MKSNDPAISKKKPQSPSQARGAHMSNIWHFESPKNKQRFVLKGDVEFYCAVLAEGDPSITKYVPNPAPVFATIDGEVRQTQLDAHVHFKDGRIVWRECKRWKDAGPNRTGRSVPQLSAQAQAALEAGVPYEIVTDRDLRGKAFLFENWLFLCGAMTRAGNHSGMSECNIIKKQVAMHGKVAVKDFLALPGANACFMLAAMARLLQLGTMQCELERSLFGMDSVLEGCRS